LQLGSLEIENEQMLEMAWMDGCCIMFYVVVLCGGVDDPETTWFISLLALLLALSCCEMKIPGIIPGSRKNLVEKC
jgi:hypothetical protein